MTPLNNIIMGVGYSTNLSAKLEMDQPANSEVTAGFQKHRIKQHPPKSVTSSIEMIANYRHRTSTWIPKIKSAKWFSRTHVCSVGNIQIQNSLQIDIIL